MDVIIRQEPTEEPFANSVDVLSDPQSKSSDQTAGALIATKLSSGLLEIDYISLESVINERFGIIPSHMELIIGLESSHWEFDSSWQSSSVIYRILNDLHTRQRFSKLTLVYLPVLKLCVILGQEPEPLLHIPRYSRRPFQKFGEQVFAEVGVPSEADHLSNLSADLVASVSKPFVFVVPGNFRTAKLNGKFREKLTRELHTVSEVFLAHGWETVSGWLLAITDTNDVSYYVEKKINLADLWEAGSADGTRDAILSNIFGENRAINIRTAKRKEERKEYKKNLAMTLQNQMHAEPLPYDEKDEVLLSQDEVELEFGPAEDKYEKVLDLISKIPPSNE